MWICRHYIVYITLCRPTKSVTVVVVVVVVIEVVVVKPVVLVVIVVLVVVVVICTKPIYKCIVGTMTLSTI